MPPDQKRAGWLITYAVSSSVYRWFVLFGIIALLYFFFDQYGLGPIGILLAVMYVAMTILMPLNRTLQFLWKQRWDVSKRIAYMGGAALVGLLIIITCALMQWKHSIREPLVILSEKNERIFVQTPGYVVSVNHDAGDTVKANDVIVTLQDPSLQNLLEQAQSRLDRARLKADTAASLNHPSELQAANTTIRAYSEQVEVFKQRINDLTLRAPVDGVIIRDTSLRRIVGNYVPPGLELCRVIRTNELEARISLPQQEAAKVKLGMPVRIRLWSNPDAVIVSKIERISSTLSDQLLHPALSSTVKGDIDVKPDQQGGAVSTMRRTTVIISIPKGGLGFLADGMTGRGEIDLGETRVYQRIWTAILDSTTPDWHL